MLILTNYFDVFIFKSYDLYISYKVIEKKNLKTQYKYFQDDAMAYDSLVNQSCDAIIAAVNRKREELMNVITHDKEMRINVLKEQVSVYLLKIFCS